MADLTATQIQDAQRAAISSIVLDTLREKAKLVPTIMDKSNEVSQGDKSLSILSASSLESGAIQDPSGGLTSKNLSLSAETLNLDKHKSIFTRIEDKAILQSVADIRAEVVKAQASELALQIDADIVDALKRVSDNPTYDSAGTGEVADTPLHFLQMGASGATAMSLDDVLEARNLLRKQNLMFDSDDYFMLISPDREKDLLALDNFQHADKLGAPSSIFSNSIGRIYGFNVIVHNGAGVAADDVICYHRDHVAMAMQMNVKAEQNRAPLQYQAEDFTLSVLYGVKVLRSGVAGVYYDGFTP